MFTSMFPVCEIEIATDSGFEVIESRDNAIEIRP